MDRKVYLIQHDIFLASRGSKFRLIKNRQKLLMKSLLSKLLAIRDLINDQTIRNSSLVFPDNLFHYVLLLDNVKNNTDSFNNFYFIKNKGLSISLEFFHFYKICIDYLFKMSFLPFAETNIDKFLYSVRPFNKYFDIPLELNKILVKNAKISYCIILSFSFYASSILENWLKKNSPLESGILRNLPSLFDFEKENQGIESFSSNSVVLNFILNGML